MGLGTEYKAVISPTFQILTNPVYENLVSDSLLVKCIDDIFNKILHRAVKTVKKSFFQTLANILGKTINIVSVFYQIYKIHR